jgi:hypothetical protein
MTGGGQKAGLPPLYFHNLTRPPDVRYRRLPESAIYFPPLRSDSAFLYPPIRYFIPTLCACACSRLVLCQHSI